MNCALILDDDQNQGVPSFLGTNFCEDSIKENQPQDLTMYKEKPYPLISVAKSDIHEGKKRKDGRKKSM